MHRITRALPLLLLLATTTTPAWAGLNWSTFLGGSADDYAYAVTHDASGDIYVAGTTASADFPTTAGVFQRTHAAYSDVFVARLRGDGSTVVWSTLIGGGGPENAMSVAVDGSGNVYVTGNTSSRDFPVSSGAFQTTFAGGQYDGFVAKFSPTGARVYSTYLGGNQDDVPLAVAVDAAGNAYVAGLAVSTNFPTTSGAVKRTHAGVFPDAGDGFVTKLNATGTALVYSTYLGTEGGTDEVFGLALDSNGRATVVGMTESRGFPVTSGVVRPTYSGGWDGFVTQLNATGSGYAFSTYLNGSGDDTPTAVMLDALNNVYVVGRTFSTNFPTTLGAGQRSYGGGTWDGFAVKLTPNASALLYGTYLGGSSSDMAWGGVVSSTGQLAVTGSTGSANFPATTGAYDASANGGDDAFVTVVSPAGTFAYSSWLGASGTDVGRGVTLQPNGRLVLGGLTNSAAFPHTTNVADPSESGLNDGFLSSIDVGLSGTVGVEQAGDAMPAALQLRVSPNPFRNTATVSLTLAEAARVSVRVVDMQGRLVRAAADADHAAGRFTWEWDGRDDRGRTTAPGVYFAQVTAGVRQFRTTLVRVD